METQKCLTELEIAPYLGGLQPLTLAVQHLGAVGTSSLEEKGGHQGPARRGLAEGMQVNRE